MTARQYLFFVTVWSAERKLAPALALAIYEYWCATALCATRSPRFPAPRTAILRRLLGAAVLPFALWRAIWRTFAAVRATERLLAFTLAQTIFEDWRPAIRSIACATCIIIIIIIIQEHCMRHLHYAWRRVRLSCS